MSVTLDLMEYATSALAQAAYVSNGLNTIISQTTGAVAWGIGDIGGVEYREAQSFTLAGNTLISGVKASFGATTGAPTGNVTCSIETDNAGKPSGTLADANLTLAFVPVASSVNISTFAIPAILAAGTYHIVMRCDNQSNDNWWAWNAVTPTAYSGGSIFYSSNGGSTWAADTAYDFNFELLGDSLQSYSEATIKTQGSYSLKGIAAITDSLNKTLTRAVDPVIDLSGQDQIKFDIYSSRIGANIKIGIRDSGGTTTEITPDILVANTWQTIILSLYAITKTNKDAIDSIIITIVNADAANTFYIDNLYGFSIAIAVSDYQIELRDRRGNLKGYLTPWVTKVSWEWNRLGGCGRCSIAIKKAYRDIIFDSRDDIQIRVKLGTTSKLVYRGFIANIVPTMKVNQDIVLDVRGYFDLLKKVIVHTAGDTRTYTDKTVAFIADDIADIFIVAKTPITIAGAITDGAFTADKLEFLGTVDDALRTLSELQGDIEYGVDEDLIFYWKTESTTINAKFFVGNDVSIFERRVRWDDLINKIYLVGGNVAGVKYKKTGENTDSQSQYYLSEQIINNSSIVTDVVAAQYMGAILTEKSLPQFSIRAQVKNTALRLEDTIPMGMVVFYDAIYDNISLGDVIGDIIGESFGGIKTVAIKAGGSGYTNGAQVLTVVQSGGANGTINVTVSGNVVTTIVSVATQGTNYTTTGVGGTGANGLATTGGGGTGCTLNISALNITSGAGSNIVIGETAAGGSNVFVGGQYSGQTDRVVYSLSNTPGRFNLEIQLGDTVLETAAKIKRIELAMSSLTQY